MYKYSCIHCDYKTNKKSNHDSHVKFVHQKEKDTCPHCGKEMANLNQHLRVAHKIFKASSREKVCEICNKKFHNLDAHKLKTHQIKVPTEFICPRLDCLKSFNKKEHLNRHESVVHLGQKQTCPYCSNQFSNLDKHIKTKHTDNNQIVKETVKVLYPCNICNKVFNKKAVLNTHKHTIHSVPMPNNKDICPYCQKSFSNMAQHIDIVHNKTKKYSCQKCQKAFYDNRELRRHHIKYLKTGECHKELPPESCRFNCDFDNCTYKTNKKSNMEMHRQSVHLNLKFPCPECGKHLSSKANLNSHVKNVHDKKLVGGVLEKNPYHIGFRCTLCDYTTNRALHLDRHMLSVHSEAAFETVEKVYQASTQPKPLDIIKPAVSNLIKTHHPRTLPQFANLVRLEKISTGEEQQIQEEEEEEEMILGGGDNDRTETGQTEDIGQFEDIQFVTTTTDGVQFLSGASDGVQLVTRRVSTDSSITVQDIGPPLDNQEHQVRSIMFMINKLNYLNLFIFKIVTQTSTFQVDANGKLILPENATIVHLSNGLVLPMPETISPIYFTLNN